MSFINWGSETPEQKELRKRLEDKYLLEQAMMRKVYEARSSATATSAAAVGSGAVAGPAFGYAADGLIYSISSLQEFKTHFPGGGSSTPFPAETILCKGDGNYFYYLFYLNDGIEYNGFYFGTINSASGLITINNNGNLEDIASNKTPASLYLEPNGNLIMLDSKAYGVIRSIIRIDTDYNGTGSWHGVEVNAVDYLAQEFGILITLFTVDGDVYGISGGTDPDYDKTVGKYDINEPEYVSGTTHTIQLYKNGEHLNYQGDYSSFEVASAVQGKDGAVYFTSFYPDPDTEGYEFGIFSLDVLTGTANWIKFAYVQDSAPIVTLFTK